MAMRSEDPFFAMFEETKDRYDNPTSKSPARVYNIMKDEKPKTKVSTKAYPVDAGVATSCGALPLGGTPVFRCWDM
jgi:hypothetical protein